uniref:Outer membrane autotransporter barrel domain-containing protein n=1 Tax=Candidatus Kentrum sp. FW TaxID=2126338 RepID=A0A450TP21_9GAMM|nr:MAG: outer membrane autotransporter barrel domain-containing protein [Candidatus Kentron sp. FW]
MRKNQEFNRSKLSKAIALACFGVASVSMSGGVYAACDQGTLTASQTNQTCTIADGKDLTLSNNYSITDSANDALIVTSQKTVGTVTVNAGSTISASANGKSGINVIGAATPVTKITKLINAGTITASGTGTGSHGVSLNTATDAHLAEIGDLTNSGTISATGTAATDHAIYLYAKTTTGSAKISGTLTNTGTISSAGGNAIHLESDGTGLAQIVGGVANSGTISAPKGKGIVVTATAAAATGPSIIGGITNEAGATITGKTHGIHVGDHVNLAAVLGSAGIINRGTIEATDTAATSFAIELDDSSTSPISVLGSSAKIKGGVQAKAAAFTVGSATETTAFTSEGTFDTSTFVIETKGTLTLGHNVTLGGTTATAFDNKGILKLTKVVELTANANASSGYTQAADATLVSVVTDKTNYGQLKIVDGTGGDVALSNAKIQVEGGVLKKGDTLDVILGSATGTLTEAGTPTVTTTNPLLELSVAKTVGTNGKITVTVDNVKTFAQVASTSAGGNDMDSSGIMAALDTIYTAEANAPTTNAVPAKMQAIMDKLLISGSGTAGSTKMGQSIAQLTPAMSGAIANVSITAANGIVGAINNRMDSVASVGSGFSSGDFGETGSWWLKPFGSFGEQDKENGIAGYDLDSRGLAMGYDTDLNNQWRVGVAGAYTRTDVDGNSSTAKQNVDIDTYQANVYGIMKLGADSRLNLQAGIGTSDYDGTRNITFMNEVNKSDYDSTHFTAGATYEKDFPMSQSSLIRANVFADYAYVDVDGYTETTTSATSNTLLKISSQDQDSMIVGVGGAYKVKPSAEGVFSLRAALGYDLLSDKSSVRAQFAGDTNNTSFTTTGIDDEPFLFRGGLGYEHKTSENMSIDARYDAELRSGFDNHAFSVKLKYNY